MKIKQIIDDLNDRAEITKTYRGAILLWPYGKDKEPYSITYSQLKTLIDKGLVVRNLGFGSNDSPHYVGKNWPFKINQSPV